MWKIVNESVYYYYNNKLRWKTATCDTFGKQKNSLNFVIYVRLRITSYNYLADHVWSNDDIHRNGWNQSSFTYIVFSWWGNVCGYSLLFLLFGYKFEIYRREGLMEMGALW
jgi:hypothetical protein